MFKPLLLINNNITIHKTGDTNVVRKILCLQENSRTYFLESPAFLPGESGIFSWRVRHFFLESPVSFPGESGISSWRVRYLFLESPAFLPGESGIFSWRVRRFFLESPVSFPGECWPVNYPYSPECVE